MAGPYTGEVSDANKVERAKSDEQVVKAGTRKEPQRTAVRARPNAKRAVQITSKTGSEAITVTKKMMIQGNVIAGQNRRRSEKDAKRSTDTKVEP